MDNEQFNMGLQKMGFLWDSDVKGATIRFQSAYCGPPVGTNTEGWLTIDGIAGPKTYDSLAWSVGHGNHLSTNFVANETWCNHCTKNFVRRELLSALEVLRGNKPFLLLDVCRCPEHNAAVSGAKDSQHLFGTAADPSTYVTVNAAKALNRFSGFEVRNDDGRAYHLDVRHIWGANDTVHNPTKSTIANPAVFPWA